jgi:hypothetical protein
MQKHFLFVSSFEHVNIVINGKYSKKNYNYPKYYVSLVIFKHRKIQFQGVSIHLGGSFDNDFTPLYKNMFFLAKGPQK